MKIKLNNFQILFLSMYMFFNTYALFYLLNVRETFGDYFKPATNEYLIFLSYLCVVLPFIFFAWFLYPYFENKLKADKALIENYSLENKISVFVLILQISFMMFNLSAGVNSAGSGVSTDSSIKYIFIIFPPDLFFFILHAYARDNKYFKYNLFIYLLSNLQRGWMGGLFFIAVMELYIYYKKYAFNKKVILIASSTVVIFTLILPYIIMFKWAARAYFGGLSTDLNSEFEMILKLGNIGYLESLGESLAYLFGRFQMLSNVYLFFEHIETLQVAKVNGDYISVFSVGLPQMLMYKIFGLDFTLLTSYFASIINTEIALDELTSNAQVGWIGWILAEPYKAILYVLYSSFLIYVSVLLSSKIGGKHIFFLTWYSMVVFLLHGWIQAYINFIIALFIFYLMKIFFQKFNLNINNKMRT